jgi:hypothetical protein
MTTQNIGTIQLFYLGPPKPWNNLAILHLPKHIIMVLVFGKNELPVGSWDSHVHIVDEVGLLLITHLFKLTKAGQIPSSSRPPLPTQES